MRFLLGFFILFFITTSVSAQETAEDYPTTPITDIAILQSPLIAKIAYRDAWEVDNQPDLSYLVQIEKMKDDGTIDETSAEIIKKTFPIMKKMSYGMKGKDVADAAQNIQANPEEAINQLANNIHFDITEEDLNALNSLKDKVAQKALEEAKTVPGKTTYSIDINAF